MQITSEKKYNKLKYSLLTILTSILFMLLLLGAFYFLNQKDIHLWFRMHGLQVVKSDKQSKVIKLIHDVLKIPSNWISSYISNSDESIKIPELPILRFDIKFKNIEKLRTKRREALKSGVLSAAENDFVPAVINESGKMFNVKIRLKGDMLGHLQGDKWSFRVHVKNDEALLGVRRFSLQHPRTRGYTALFLFSEALKMIQSDIIIPRYQFVKVVVNGQNLGIMLLIEHFAKELLESSRRSESVILKLDESIIWKAIDRGKFNPIYLNVKNTKVDAFQIKKIKSSEKLNNDYIKGVGLLRSFINGVLSPSDVFDAKTIGEYLATLDLFAYWHGSIWRNMRFYYNPITSKLEPIVFDVYSRNSRGILPSQKNTLNEIIVPLWVSDKNIMHYYKQAAIKYLSLIKTNQLQKRLRTLDANIRKIISMEFFLLQPLDVSYLEGQIKCMFDTSLCYASKHGKIDEKKLNTYIDEAKKLKI